MQLYTSSLDKFKQMCQTLGCCFTFKKEPLCKFMYPIFQNVESSSIPSNIPECYDSNNITETKSQHTALEPQVIEKNIEEEKDNHKSIDSKLFNQSKKDNKSINEENINHNQNIKLDTFMTRNEEKINVNTKYVSNQKNKDCYKNLTANLNSKDEINLKKSKNNKKETQEFEIEGNFDNIPEYQMKKNPLEESPVYSKEINNNQKRIEVRKKTRKDHIQINQDPNRLPVYHLKDIKELKNFQILKNIKDLKQVSENQKSNDSHIQEDAEKNSSINEKIKDSNQEIKTYSNNFSKQIAFLRRSIKPDNSKNISIGKSNLLNVQKININKEENLEYSNTFCPYKHFTNIHPISVRYAKREKSTDNNREPNKININYAEFLRQNAKKAWNVADEDDCNNKTTFVDKRQFKEETNQEIKIDEMKKSDGIDDWD